MNTVVLLREELRLNDNPLYDLAARRGDAVLPLFVWDRAAWGDWLPGGAGRWWLHHSLLEHRRSLEKMGSSLLIRRGDTLAEILSLRPRRVIFGRRFEPAARVFDRALAERLRAAGIEVQELSTRSLFEPKDMLNGQGQPYKVFTPFSRLAASLLPSLPPPLPQPSSLPPPASWPESLPLEDLQLLPSRDWADGFSKLHRPGEAGAMARLEEFCRDGIEDYSADRDLPAVDGVSRLSAPLHFGEISPRQVISRAEASSKSAAPFVRQILWREFAFHLLWAFPETPHREWRSDWLDFPWLPDDSSLLKAWRQGRTGFPIVDAGMRELRQTGLMHNRVRMIAASLLVKNGLQDWRRGAAWFWDNLVDADLANNTLGWQWVAGCGADAAPYFRIFNPVLQSQRFDPEGLYIRRWVPEIRSLPSKILHAPWQQPLLCSAAGVSLGQSYPWPVLDLAATRERALAARGASKEED
ncbi:MAG: Deoxyribodipyrimidine photo-lyase [Verrucomicrobiota bacterium]|jgi:deoxyribodipyrimidine photo-lyase